MLTSLAYVFLLGMLLGWVFSRIGLPSLLGMLVTGILLGPCVLNLLDPALLGISADLRQLALIIILTRAGLSLNIADLKRVGRPAVLMCFVPACFEICGMVLLAPKMLGITALEAAVMGAVIAAVSPAVIVPKMLRLMEEGYGTAKSIPQMILAGASVDDVFVIVLFTAFTGISQGDTVAVMDFLQVPLSILLGIACGAALGHLLALLFRKKHMRDTAKVLIILSAAFLLVALENRVKGIVPFSGLIAVMCLGILLQRNRPEVAVRLSAKFSRLWVAAEVLLFVLVGAAVDIRYAAQAGPAVVLLLCCVLLFRMAGVFCCMLGTVLNAKERLFCMIAYMPKATVQAAIGAVPLSMGLACGQIVLTVAVLSILITAPLGAFGVERTYKLLLRKK